MYFKNKEIDEMNSVSEYLPSINKAFLHKPCSLTASFNVISDFVSEF